MVTRRWPKAVLAAAVVALASAVPGCGITWGEECHPDATKCEKNVAMYCGRDLGWHRTDCGAHFCIEALIGTYSDTPSRTGCAFSPDPDPLCLPSGPDGTSEACDGNRLVRCRLGYRVEEFDCAARHCVDMKDKGWTLCALSADKDDLCVSKFREDGDVCEGNVVVSCRSYYRVNEKDCGAGYCVVARFCKGAALCAVQPAEDWRCGTDAWNYDDRWGNCDGTLAITCSCGYRTHQRECTSCVTDARGYLCR